MANNAEFLNNPIREAIFERTLQMEQEISKSLRELRIADARAATIAYFQRGFDLTQHVHMYGAFAALESEDMELLGYLLASYSRRGHDPQDPTFAAFSSIYALRLGATPIRPIRHQADWCDGPDVDTKNTNAPTTNPRLVRLQAYFYLSVFGMERFDIPFAKRFVQRVTMIDPTNPMAWEFLVDFCQVPLQDVPIATRLAVRERMKNRTWKEFIEKITYSLPQEYWPPPKVIG